MPRIVVANFYQVVPVEHGGQRRIFYLAREIAREHDVTMVTLTRGRQMKFLEMSPRFREIQVPAPRKYVDLERELSNSVSMTADVAFALHWKQCELYQGVLEEQVRSAQLVISEHPYSFYAVQDAIGRRQIPFIYNSQNVEVRQKRPVLVGRKDLFSVVKATERAAIARSEIVLACSETDRDTFVAKYSVPKSKIRIVRNGVDCSSAIYIGPARRREMRNRLGLDDSFTAVFGGSFHFPNIAAAKSIVEIGRELPNITFLILGSICESEVLKVNLPKNIRLLGSLSEPEKWVTFGVSDLALNPMTHGSGSNIKMFEYSAAQLPTLSTKFGARGTGFVENIHYLAAEIEEFPAALRRAASTNRADLITMGNEARALVLKTADWSVIGREYRSILKTLFAGLPRSAASL